MYLAEYNIGGVTWHQLAASLTYPSADARGQSARWWARFNTLLRNLDAVPQASTSLRVRLGERLQATLIATAPASESEHLRRAVGSFTQLAIVADGNVEYPRSRGEHDCLLEFPPLQCLVAQSALTSGDAWFAFDFRAQEYLNELLLEARPLEHVVSYHLNVERLAIEPEWQRLAARNAFRVSNTAGVPSSLEQLQSTLAANLRRATHVCEELVGVETPRARDWLRKALERRFGDTYGANVKAAFNFDEGTHEGSLTATRHRVAFETLAADEICAAAVDSGARVRLLSWEPAPELRALMPTAAVTESEMAPVTLLDYSGMPQPYDGAAAYAFISYKREDLHRLKAPVAELDRRGHRVWYDKGIPGGAEWDALIEERLQNCSLLVLFLSQAAVESRWVRRELKFADALNKPIVAVRMDRDIVLSHGLAMLLNQYQVIDADASALHGEIDRAIRFLRESRVIQPGAL